MKKPKLGLVAKLGTALLGFTLAFGTIEGMTANMRPFDSKRIEDTTFKHYLESGKRQNGDNLGTYAMALCTYSGAYLGARIHNYGLPENSQ